MGDWYAPSGKYAVLVGHASDDIRLSTELHFTARKLLPLVVDNATTIGELMADPRTAPVVSQMQAQMGEGMLDMNDPGMAAMMEAMISGLPLKSLITFGMMQPEQFGGLIHALNISGVRETPDQSRRGNNQTLALEKALRGSIPLRAKIMWFSSVRVLMGQQARTVRHLFHLFRHIKRPLPRIISRIIPWKGAVVDRFSVFLKSMIPLAYWLCLIWAAE